MTVDGDDVIFRFNGGEKEEAELLTDLVASGALIHNYMRDLANIEEISEVRAYAKSLFKSRMD